MYKFASLEEAIQEVQNARAKARALKDEANTLELKAARIEGAIPYFFGNDDNYKKLQNAGNDAVFGKRNEKGKAFYIGTVEEFLSVKGSSKISDIHDHLSQVYGKDAVHVEALKSALKRAHNNKNSHIMRDPRTRIGEGYYMLENKEFSKLRV